MTTSFSTTEPQTSSSGTTWILIGPGVHGAQLFLSRLVEHPDLEGCAASEHSPGGVVVRQWDDPTHRIASARPTDRSLLLLRRDLVSAVAAELVEHRRGRRHIEPAVDEEKFFRQHAQAHDVLEGWRHALEAAGVKTLDLPPSRWQVGVNTAVTFVHRWLGLPPQPMAPSRGTVACPQCSERLELLCDRLHRLARCSHCDDHREQAQALPHPENGNRPVGLRLRRVRPAGA